MLLRSCHSQYRLIVIAFTILFCFERVSVTKGVEMSIFSSSRKTLEKLSKFSLLKNFRGGFNAIASSDISDDDDIDDGNYIEFNGSPNTNLNGQYIRSDENINGFPHYERIVTSNNRNETYHMYWTGTQWVIHKDTNPSLNIDNLLAYAKVNVSHPKNTNRHWNIRTGKIFEPVSNVIISCNGYVDESDDNRSSSVHSDKVDVSTKGSDEILGIPKRLVPLYLAFLLDSIAVGMAMPLLPFFVMELGAKAIELSFVVSSNYIVQMIGCLIMGVISDRLGRRIVLLSCLSASSLSYFFVSKSYTLLSVVIARIIVGSCGGLVPVMQTCVADVSSPKDRPKYLGRVTATFGLGFVLGPFCSTLLANMPIRNKIRIASLLPLLGFIIALIFFRETKKFDDIEVISSTNDSLLGSSSSTRKINKNPNLNKTTGLPIILLVINGFMIMYAFATETIYAMFLKDSFGYGEKTLSKLFAINGLFIGIFQVFFIKPLVNTIGKHLTLISGNLLLALGMVGIALIRHENLHFIVFTAHIVGYSIADTALALLITRYSNIKNQGRDLAFNQAAQSCARVLSPLFAGMLYEHSKKPSKLPNGALPFLAGALFPALGIFVPLLLYMKSVASKKKRKSQKEMVL